MACRVVEAMTMELRNMLKPLSASGCCCTCYAFEHDVYFGTASRARSSHLTPWLDMQAAKEEAVKEEGKKREGHQKEGASAMAVDGVAAAKVEAGTNKFAAAEPMAVDGEEAKARVCARHLFLCLSIGSCVEFCGRFCSFLKKRTMQKTVETEKTLVGVALAGVTGTAPGCCCCSLPALLALLGSFSSHGLFALGVLSNSAPGCTSQVPPPAVTTVDALAQAIEAVIPFEPTLLLKGMQTHKGKVRHTH